MQVVLVVHPATHRCLHLVVRLLTLPASVVVKSFCDLRAVQLNALPLLQAHVQAILLLMHVVRLRKLSFVVL